MNQYVDVLNGNEHHFEHLSHKYLRTDNEISKFRIVDSIL